MIVNGTLNSKEQVAYEHYVSSTGPIFKKFEGKLLEKYKISKTIVGNQITQFVVVMEFPNDEAIKNVFECEEYKVLLPYREKAFVNLSVFIRGKLK